MMRIIQKIVWTFYYKIKNLYNRNTFKVSWDIKYDNFGDIITPYILKELTDKKIERINKSSFYPYEHYLIIGSILDRATKHTIIWGSGLISEDSKPLEHPKRIFAVRGPKTRAKLLKLGIECPEVYGDPALLLPKIYFPKIEKKYKLGIIPHYVDKNILWLNKIDNNEIKIIDIQTKDPRKFIDELLSCEKIASSSLHGIITADAYSIPSVWLEFSQAVVGNGFKFYDYFLSVGRKDQAPLFIDKDTKISEIFDRFYEYKIKIDLELLLEACPLKKII